MAVFVYQGRSAGGMQNGEIEAPDRSAAVGELRRRAILVTKIAEKTAPKISFKFGGKVNDKEMAIFTRQFSTMIDAGLPLVQCLNILAEQTRAHRKRRAPHVDVVRRTFRLAWIQDTHAVSPRGIRHSAARTFRSRRQARGGHRWTRRSRCSRTVSGHGARRPPPESRPIFLENDAARTWSWPFDSTPRCARPVLPRRKSGREPTQRDERHRGKFA